MTVTLREVAESDAALLFELYASTREFELSQVPWSAEQKQAFLEMQFTAQARGYAERYPEAAQQMICADGEPVGRLWLDRAGEDIHILDITVAPARRNAGIGGAVLGGLIEEADRSGHSISIYTESFNPSLRLLQRLGFEIVSIDGYLLRLERPNSPR